MSYLLVALNLFWHCCLLAAVFLSDQLIEFRNWYFQLAVVVPPAVTLLACVILLLRNGKRLRWKGILMAAIISFLLAALHWRLLVEAAAIV
ncbi:MAG: hypothetical protein SH850_21425 [Planctomycetaceae bacterium]|nr:hypothetical protein [Planctomycetaceae bacterium]